MSLVYLARDRQLLEKRVVIKVLLDESSLDPWIRQKFLQEMEALSRIDHPGVVGVLDTGLTAERKQFLVMQYIEGRTLRSVIEPGGMNHTRAAGLIRQIAQALAAAHEKGVWHRDLKPENIMVQSLGGEEHVKLIDFGIAGIQDSQFSGEETKVAGSAAYMAPEQFDGRPCAASDTYALGIVAYEMLTGKRPAGSAELGPELSDAVRRSILKAMSFHMEQRHANVREFGEELYRALAGGEPTRRITDSGAVEMAHVLFTDLVGYSLLPMDQQKEYLGQLQQIVRDSPQFRAAEAAGDIISLPTGDGMALAFFGDPTAPAQCALEVAAGLKSQPHLKLRMGIHSGPVYRVADVNANANVAGGGINMAQRVMDCGDAGHILVSKSVADVLLQLSQWSPYLSDLGECTVKHGVKVHLCNLVAADLGNAKRPRKLGGGAAKAKFTKPMTLALAFGLVAVAGALWFGKSSLPVLDRQSIAVLPFADLSPEKNQQFFSEGVAEAVLNALSKIPGLQVAGKTSSFRFTDKTGDYRAIGKTLNVATILEGSVGKQGNRAKVTTRLIKVSDGYQLWSDEYNRDMNDIFAVQEEIGRAVTGALKVTLAGGKTAEPSTRATNAEAYNAYLQGRYFFGRRNRENLERAIGYFEQATLLDPSYAPAWVGLGESYTNQAGSAYVPVKDGYRKARQAVDRALKLDPDLAEAYVALGRIQMFGDWDWDGADKSFQRTRALERGNVRELGSFAILDRTLGRLDEAIALYRRALAIDPLNPGAFHNAGIALYYAGKNDEAEAAFKRSLELVPEKEITRDYLAQVYLAQSRPEEALAEEEKEKNGALRLCGLALAYHALKRTKESELSLGELKAKFSKDAPYQIAQVYAFRGDADRAFEWLERAYNDRDTGLVQLKGDPLLKRLERDPRHAALMRKMRLPL